MWRRPSSSSSSSYSMMAALVANTRRKTSGTLVVLKRRRFSSDTKQTNNVDASSLPSSSSPEEAARNLSWMAQLVVSDSSIATEWSKTLSPQARVELNKIRQLSTLNVNDIPEPSKRDLRLTFLNQAIPFVGFGIMDNSILIIAGDAIDTSLGVALGISTMCAAAIGNIISDIAGIMMGSIIEDFSARLGLPAPNISAAQRTLRSVRFAGQLGTTVGMVVGCIIGMFPLLLIDSNKVQRLKNEAHMDHLFRDVVTEAKDLIGAQSTRLFLVEQDERGNSFLYGQYNTKGVTGHTQSKLRVKMGKGIVSRAALTGEAVNVYDVQTEPDFAREIWDDATELKNMVCVPVLNSQGRVIAVIQAINKIGKGVVVRDNDDDDDDDDDDSSDDHTTPIGVLRPGGFTTSDVQVLKVLASHVSVALQVMLEEETELSLRDTIRTLKEHGIAGLIAEDDSSRGMSQRPLFPV